MCPFSSSFITLAVPLISIPKFGQSYWRNLPTASPYKFISITSVKAVQILIFLSFLLVADFQQYDTFTISNLLSFMTSVYAVLFLPILHVKWSACHMNEGTSYLTTVHYHLSGVLLLRVLNEMLYGRQSLI